MEVQPLVHRRLFFGFFRRNDNWCKYDHGSNIGGINKHTVGRLVLSGVSSFVVFGSEGEDREGVLGR